MNIVAIIPAKGNSRRLFEKNIHPIWAKPMLYWAIKACKDSKYDIEPWVSTESEKIAKVALKHGAKVHNRSPELSDSKTYKQVVIRDAAKFISSRDHHPTPDIYISLQPNSPQIKGRQLDNAIDTLLKYNRDEVFSVGLDLMQNAAFRVFKGEYVFQEDLSTNCGVVVCDLHDVHDKDDVGYILGQQRARHSDKQYGFINKGWKNEYFKYFNINKGDVVIDLGASKGDFASMCMEVEVDKCYSVEAAEKHSKILENNLNNWNRDSGYKRFHGIKKGIIGQQSGDDWFVSGVNAKKGPDDCIRIPKPEEYPNGFPYDLVVETIPFMKFIEENSLSKKQIDFFKMDIEGSEYLIFSDEESFNFILNNVQKIVIEFHLHYLREVLNKTKEETVEITNDIIEKFCENGFKVICRPHNPAHTLEGKEPTEDTYCMDFWAFKEEDK